MKLLVIIGTCWLLLSSCGGNSAFEARRIVAKAILDRECKLKVVEENNQ